MTLYAARVLRARIADDQTRIHARLSSSLCKTLKRHNRQKFQIERMRVGSLYVELKRNAVTRQNAPIALTEPPRVFTLVIMEVHLKPETESRLNELASKSGRATDDLVEDAMAGYLAEVIEVRGMPRQPLR